MGRVCTVCTHPKRGEIDRALAEGNGSKREVAQKYGLVTASMHRHANDHLPQRVLAAADRAEFRVDDALIEQVKWLASRVSGWLEQAERAGDEGRIRDCTACAREMRGCMDLFAKLTGAYAAVQVTHTVDWTAVRTKLVAILADYPEARAHVVREFGGAPEPKELQQ